MKKLDFSVKIWDSTNHGHLGIIYKKRGRANGIPRL